MVTDTTQYMPDVVMTTRIRLARNLSGFPFPSQMRDHHAEEILYLVDATLKKIDRDAYTRYDIGKLKSSQLSLLQEQYLISAELAKRSQSAAFVSSDRTVSIMVNEEDHLREQYICKGFALMKAYERLTALDDGLSGVLDFAFDHKLGYLTACPSNLGTGMRASVMMFLPGLTWKGEIKNIFRVLKTRGMTMRGSYGEGSDAEGYLYQVSNERTLGWSEKEILEEVSEFVKQLCVQEHEAREEMKTKVETEVRDRCLRSYGTLCNCALLDMSEFLSKIVDVKLGLALGYLTVVKGQNFELFMDDMKPAAFCLNNHLEGETERFYDEVRAETVGSVLPKIVQVVRRGA